MTEKQEALLRTLKPIVGGSIIGLLMYFAITYLSVAVITSVVILALVVYFTYLLYDHNLMSVRNEREWEKSSE